MPEERPHQDLEQLDDRLARARENAGISAPEKQQKNTHPGSALGLAMRVGVELVSALAIGVFVGWGLDTLFGTGPWLLLVFILLGGGAGILNVYRMASGFGYTAGYQKDDDPANRGPEIED